MRRLVVFWCAGQGDGTATEGCAGVPEVILARRSFLAGLGSLLAAPAIVHAGNLMPVKRVILTPPRHVLYDHPSSIDAAQCAYDPEKWMATELKNQPVSILPGHITYAPQRGKWIIDPEFPPLATDHPLLVRA